MKFWSWDNKTEQNDLQLQLRSQAGRRGYFFNVCYNKVRCERNTRHLNSRVLKSTARSQRGGGRPCCTVSPSLSRSPSGSGRCPRCSRRWPSAGRRWTCPRASCTGAGSPATTARVTATMRGRSKTVGKPPRKSVTEATARYVPPQFVLSNKHRKSPP